MRGGALVTTLLSGLSAHAANVIVGDKEWRQLTDTVGVSYAQVASICDVQCSGTLTNLAGETIDFTGWNWASGSEVLEMTQSFGVPNGIGGTSLREINSAWAPALLSVFEFTDQGFFPSGNAERLRGYRRTTANGLDTEFLALVVDTTSSTGEDLLNWTNGQRLFNPPVDNIGVWLYKDIASVPLPAAFWVFASALAGAASMKRLSSKEPTKNV